MNPAAIPAPRDSGYTSTTGAPLYWCAYGTPGAPRLLVLHGGPGAQHDYLLPQMLELAHGHELVFYDQRGGGRSKDDGQQRITWQTHVEDLAAVVREMEIAPLTMVGYSWGALLALLYSLEAARGAVAPAAERLVLLDPAPLSRRFRAVFEEEMARRQNGPEIQRLRAELAGSGLRDRDPGAYRRRAFELSVAGYFADPRAARNLTPFRVTSRVQQSVWESLGEFDLLAPGQLDAVRIPALVVHGRQDPIPLESSEGCARALGARLVVLEDSGHVPYVEQPVALFAAISRFLSPP